MLYLPFPSTMAMVGEQVNTALAGVDRQSVVGSDQGWTNFLQTLVTAIQEDLQAAVQAATEQAAAAAPPAPQPPARPRGQQRLPHPEFHSQVFQPNA